MTETQPPVGRSGGGGVEQTSVMRAAEAIVRLRWLWIAMTLVIVVVSALGLGRLTLDPSARVFFDPKNPDRIALDRFETIFAKDDNLMFVIAPKGGDVFTPEMLALQGRITECLWRLPFVRRVNSLTNFQHTYAEADDMIVRDLVPDQPYGRSLENNACDLDLDAVAVTPEMAAEAREIALSRVELLNSFVDPDGEVAQVQTLFKLPGLNKAQEVPVVAAEALALAEQVEAAFPDVSVKLSGAIMINNQFAGAAQADGQLLTPLMFLAILVLVGLTLRSVIATFMTLIVIIVSSLAGLGALAWSGVPINSVTALSYLYISTLAVASAVHILASVRQTMPETEDRREWARRALSEHMVAIIVACVTTAIGFLSLNFSISPPFRQLGNIVAFGVIVSMVLTLTLLPALVTLLPMRRRLVAPTAAVFMARLGDWVVDNRRMLLPGMALMVVLCGLGIQRIVLEDDFVRYFDERFQFRKDVDFIEAELTGINLLEWPLDSGETDGINDPEYLAKVSAFVDWMREQPEVTSVRSVTDTIKRLNMNMNSDDPSYYRLPKVREEASQYLFLYELSMNYGMDLTDQIDIDRRIMRVSNAMTGVTTADMRAFTERAKEWLSVNAPDLTTGPDGKRDPTGLVHVFNLISERDVKAMLGGTVLALVLISGVLLFVLRDVKVGVVSLVPNLIPAVMAFGVWGYTAGAVTLAIAVVLAATLGIVVDDTVHFLSKYVKARREGKSPEDSVRYVFRTVGMALLITTLALIAGFLVLAQSGFAVNGDLARLTALTIAIALIADFLLLPPLLIVIDRMMHRKRSVDMTPSKSAATTAALCLALPLAAVLLAPGTARAETPEEKGLAIAVEADKRDLGWSDIRVDGEMVLRDASGRESRRTYENLFLEVPASELGDKSIIVFDSPRDIRGTGLLTHAEIEPKDDNQWLYLPAIKRVKRISSSNRTGKFVSSEFSYEDLGAQEVDDYEYKWLRDEPCPGAEDLTCFVSESYPKNQRSGYSKRVSWTDQNEYRLMQVEFYNRRGDLEKVLTFNGYQQYLDKYWRADKLTMVNKQTGKETDLISTNYRFKTGLENGQFVSQALPRMAR
ncbi:MAG: outer membrane lipoprotein-sorting protein [Rhodobacteraceae bacterium]|nr:outer membrane lipoprotein-sorting protein [Paracoccaceae bacterium]